MSNIIVLLHCILILTTTVFNIEGEDVINHQLKEKSCWVDSTLVECFKKCKDSRQTVEVYSAASVTGTAGKTNVSQYIRNRKKNGLDPFGCLVKCMTYPELELCRRECQPPPVDFISECQLKPECKKQGTTTAWKDPDCMLCYKHAIFGYNDTFVGQVNICNSKENNQDKCYETIEKCALDPTVTTAEELKDCFLTLRMETDLSECQVNSEACKTTGSDVLCDAKCRKYLRNDLCQDTCVKEADRPFDLCIKECDTKTAPLCNDACDSVEKCFTDCLADPFLTLDCFSMCEGRFEEIHQLSTLDGKTRRDYYSPKCYNAKIEEIKLYITDPVLRSTVFPAGTPSEYDWILKRFTPEECKETCESAPLKTKCYEDMCKKDLTESRRSALCIKNPFRIKALVLYAAAGGKSLQWTAIESSFPNDFSDYVYDAGNAVVHDKFVELFQTKEDACKTDCTGTKNTEEMELSNAQCNYDCFEKHKVVCKYEPVLTVELTDFANCHWTVDLSESKLPYTLWATYFDDKGSYDEKDKLEKPNATQYLETTVVSDSQGYFVFPYFVVVRADCDGGYYDENFYRLFMYGNSPSVELQYFPATARDTYQNLLKGVFTSALINLNRDENVAADIMVPENPLETARGNGKSSEGCHVQICYPGFAVPMLLYNIPSFEVTVAADDVFSKLSKKVYVSSFHQHAIGGSGALKITNAYTNSESLVIPRMLFPQERINESEDEELASLKDCFDVDIGYCPLIEPVPNPTNPLDGEDFFSPQYTFGTAPQVGIAGFYHPNLLIVGDPDMHNLNLVNWTYQQPDQNATVFDFEYPCLQTFSAGKFPKYPKPMYSQVDRTDPKFPLKYYRTRFDPRDYTRAAQGDANAFGIFEVIALEDRFLLVTVSGLVVFYGTTNATASANRHFKAYDTEKIRKCFKFVRIAKTAQMTSDLVVGVTYTYNVRVGQQNELVNVNQELHVAKYVKAGERLEWHLVAAIGTDKNEVENVDYNIPGDPAAGTIVTLEPGKPIGPPAEERIDNAKSEIERICYKAYTEKMSSSKEILLKENQGWCEAIDASPVITKRDTIQILVRMTVFFTGKAVPPNAALPSEIDRNVVFYILASHTLRKSKEQKVLWIIDSIIPRIACVDEHKESVENVVLFDLNYFSVTGTDHNGNAALGCQNINRKYINTHIYLTRMSYTRTTSNHLFVYGSRILQSTDAGLTFVDLHSFPHKGNEYGDKLPPRLRHRIDLLVFGNGGHYAFLTNQRELWIGNTGDLVQIRIRPSAGYSMTQTIISQVKGLQDGIPFTLMYDSRDKLFELVSVLNKEGQVERILKRPVPISLILRNIKLNEEMAKKSKELTEISRNPGTPPRVIPEVIDYDTAKWNLYCPFSSPRFSENYSSHLARNQVFSFSPPRQHHFFGKSYTHSSLQAFQVATYTLIWKAFFRISYTPYSHVERDPFQLWVQAKAKTAEIGLLKFLRGSPESDGILIAPDKNKRIFSSQKGVSRLFRYYYLDYGLTLIFEMSYSIKSQASLDTTDYFTHQISQIQLNVDNANGSLLQIDTEKIPMAAQAAVKFLIKISVTKSELLHQSLPGQSLIPVPIVFHLIGAFGNCVKRKADPLVSDTVSTLVYVGCRPSTDILFDWNETLHSIKFRDKEAHFGKEPGECYGGEFVCFFARSPMIIHLDIFDMSRQAYLPYTGNYVMRIIGGGYTRETMKEYTPEQIEAYNIPGVSDVSLIWNEWSLEKQQKVDKKILAVDANDKDPKKLTRETVLRAGVSAIQWACHTLSPCARISPNIGFQTIYWFTIQISNKNVDNSTLCLYETKFDIMLYGFPPSPETQLMTTILFCLCMLGVLYLLFICTRGHKRVWRASKVKMYGWYQIVKDTFPKPLKTYEAEGIDEGHTQQQKDNIILSLQGHLKIPELMARDSGVGEAEVEPRGSTFSIETSNMSLKSRLSTFSKQQVLNPVATRNAATTWTDLVYEQIIAKRLTAIVEKNNRMRANILRKASVRLSSDTEHEKRYEQEHKRTVSEELFEPGEQKDDKNTKK